MGVWGRSPRTKKKSKRSIGLKLLQTRLWAPKPASDSCCNTGTIPLLSLNHRVRGTGNVSRYG